MEFGRRVFVGGYFLPVNHVRRTALVEADGDFENQEEVVARGADPPHHFGNFVRFRQRFVDGGSQFLDQLLEVVVEFQCAPVRIGEFTFLRILWPALQDCQGESRTQVVR